MSAGPARAVTALFVPATRADRIEKAIAAGADVVIADLEDSVAPGQREAARQGLAEHLDAHPTRRIALRVNNSAEALAEDLVLAERYAEQIETILLPKVESGETIARVARLGRPVWALIESPAGLFALADIAQAPGVARLGLGGVDLAQEIGADTRSAGGRLVLDQVRAQLVLHSAAAGLSPPIESPYVDFKDLDGLRQAAERVRGMGFGGMLCIHPSQIAPVREAFMPSTEQHDWAARVVAAAEIREGAFQLDGEMIDTPVLARARRILEQAGPD